MRLWSLYWSIVSLCPGRFGTRVKIFLFLRLPTKSIGISVRKLGQRHKKAEGLPLLGIGYDDIIGIVWLSSFYSWTSVQKSDKRFCLQNRFTLICVSCWCVECYKCLCCTFPKEDSPTVATLIFYKRKVGIAAICLGLQNALNISDNSSIYNYYGTNRVIIV